MTTSQTTSFDGQLNQAWTLMLSDPAQASEWVAKARATPGITESERCRVDFHEGWCRIFLGQYVEALAWLSQALSLAERLQQSRDIMRVCNALGMAFTSIGQYGQALHYYERSLALNRDWDDVNGIFATLLNLASLHFEIDDLDEAEHLLNEALGYDSRHVFSENLGEAALLQARIHAKQMHYPEALLGCRAALEYARELDFAHLEIQSLIVVAHCQRLQDRLVEAETTLQVTIDHPEFANEGVPGLTAFIELAKVQAATGRFSHAVRTLRQGLRQDGLPEFSLIQQRALETLAVCLERARKYRAATVVMRVALGIERQLQNQDIRRQVELRRIQERMDAERLAREVTDHENRLLKGNQSRLQLINDLARQLAASQNVEEIGHTLYGIVKDRLDVHFVSLALNRPDVNALEFATIVDSGTRVPVYSLPYSVTGSRAVRVVKTREPLLLGDETEDPEVAWIGDSPVRSKTQLFIPLIHNRTVLGLVSLQSGLPNRFSPEDLKLLTALAPFIAITLSNALSHQRLSEMNQALTYEKSQIEAAQAHIEHMANHDTLTGLPNRRLLVHYVEQKKRLADTQGLPFYLVYVDLDGFKPINDRYGHRMGDTLLTVVSQRLKDALRKSDFAARVGGDEFIVIIDECDPSSDLTAFVRRILSVIEKPADIERSRLSVSASIGVARYGVHGDDLDQLMHHADVAMYGIKRTGKGGIGFAGDTPSLN